MRKKFFVWFNKVNAIRSKFHGKQKIIETKKKINNRKITKQTIRQNWEIRCWLLVTFTRSLQMYSETKKNAEENRRTQKRRGDHRYARGPRNMRDWRVEVNVVGYSILGRVRYCALPRQNALSRLIYMEIKIFYGAYWMEEQVPRNYIQIHEAAYQWRRIWATII